MIKKHIKKLVSIVLSAVMVIGMSTTAFAATPMTLEEAKEYLSSYNVTKTNAAGKEYTTQYVFDSESDLNKAAAYIVEHGLDNFNNTLDVAISEAVTCVVKYKKIVRNEADILLEANKYIMRI